VKSITCTHHFSFIAFLILAIWQAERSRPVRWQVANLDLSRTRLQFV
jgi:hypothetical protein